MSGQSDGNVRLRRASALIDQANRDPGAVIREASASLDEADPDTRVQSTLHRAVGLALRIDRRPREAVPHLRESVRLGEVSGDRQLTGLALLSLALAESYLGDTKSALTTIDRALDSLRGIDRADARFQRGLILQLQADYPAALDDFRAALPAFRRAGRDDWVADLLANRGIVHAYRGAAGRARQDFAHARELFAGVDDELGVASMVHNVAWVDGLAGDVAAALSGYEEAERLLIAAGFPVETVAADRGEALMSAGLFSEAIEVAAHAARELRQRGMELEEAESLVVLTEACAHSGRSDDGRAAAARAVDLLTRQEKPVWLLRARLADVRSQGSAADVDETIDLIESFDDARLANSATEACILAAELLTERDEPTAAAALLERRDPNRLAPENSIAWWQAEANRRLSMGHSGSAAKAAAAGLRAVRLRQARANTSEVRAHLGRSIQRLAEVGIAHAVHAADPPRFVSWVDELGWVPPPAGRATDRADTLLFELRATAHELTHVAESDADRARLATRHRRLTRTLRARREDRPARSVGAPVRLDPRNVTLSAFGRHDNRVWTASSDDGRLRIRSLGSADELDEAVQRFAFLVRTAMWFEPTDDQSRQLERQAAVVDALLGHPGEGRSGPMVFLPEPALDACATGFLPSLAGVTQLHATTLRTAAPIAHRTRAVTSVAGPRLDHADSEAEAIARLHQGGHALTGETATVEATRLAFERADVVHIAAHARRSLDSAYFDSLELADGSLSIHELQTLATPPHTVVLAACEAGHRDAVDDAQRFGLVAALDGIGVRRTIASPFPVPDDTTNNEAMSALHEHLRLGQPADAALSAAQNDPGLSTRASTILRAFRCAGRPSAS